MSGVRVGVLAVLLAVAAACGGDEGSRQVSATEYSELLEAAVADFGPRIDELEEFDVTGAQAQEQGARLLDALRRQVDTLGGVEPPAGANEAHDELVDGLDELSDHIAAELADMEMSPESDADRVEDRLLREGEANPAFAKLERAGQALFEAGYLEEGG
jgi:hypothetical protein